MKKYVKYPNQSNISLIHNN